MLSLQGQRYHSYLVISEVSRSKTGQRRWLCKCDCGEERIVLQYNLRSGHSKSCGCLYRLPEGQAAKNHLLAQYKKGAKQRNLVWELESERFFALTQQDCHYCGRLPSQEAKTHSSTISYFYNGVDRVDNLVGYVESNCVPCCKFCNIMKGSLCFAEFFSHVRRIHKHTEEAKRKMSETKRRRRLERQGATI